MFPFTLIYPSLRATSDHVKLFVALCFVLLGFLSTTTTTMRVAAATTTATATATTRPKEIVGIGVWVNNLGRENLQHATFDGDTLISFLRNDLPDATAGDVCNGLSALAADNARYSPSLVNAGRFPFIVNRTTEYRVIVCTYILLPFLK